MGPAINYLLVGASGHDLTIPSTMSADDELDDLMVTDSHCAPPPNPPPLTSISLQVVVTPTGVNIFCGPSNWNHIQKEAHLLPWQRQSLID